MKADRTTQLIDYLEGNLPAPQRQALERELAGSAELRRELEDLRTVLRDLEGVEEEAPPARLRDRFYAFLDEEKESSQAEARKHRFRLGAPDWRIAAAVALLVIGVGFGALWQRNLRQQEQIQALVDEVQQTRKLMVLSLLEQNSASQRIKALNTVQRERPGHDPQIVEALLRTLHTDDNINVRVKAAEALLEFADRPEVIDALVAALPRQEHPEVQITLIDVLVALKAKQAVDEFRHILEAEEKLDVVKNRAAAGIEQLM